MPYTKQGFAEMQENLQPLCAEHLIAMEEGIIEAYTGIKRVVSYIDGEPMVDLRDLESGVYMLYGYFSPYKDSHSTMVVNNELVHVAHKTAGSHIMCISPLNSKLTFIEILVDDTTADGFTYSHHSYDMLAIDGLRDRVKALEDANATLTDMAKGKAPAIPVDASGEIVSITDGAAMPVLSLVSHITAAEDGTGRNAVSVTRTGKNIFGGMALAQSIASKVEGATLDENAKTIMYTSTGIRGVKVFDRFEPGKQYTIVFKRDSSKSKGTTANIRVIYDAGDAMNISFSDGDLAVVTTRATNNAMYLLGYNSSGPTYLFYEECGIFEGVLTAEEFVPYEGQTLTTDLPETVTDGALDWTTGVLTINEDGASRTVQLTTQQLDLLKGTNNIWSSTGETAVTYVADTQLYIDAKIAALAAAQVNN